MFLLIIWVRFFIWYTLNLKKFTLQLSEWSPWSDCSVACGTGKKMKRRMEKRGPCPADTVYTQTQSCEGACEGTLQ